MVRQILMSILFAVSVPAFCQTDGDDEEYFQDIEPLITTHWDREEPYNDLFPVETIACGNIVMLAQIMKYHHWPEGETKEIPRYRKNSRYYQALPPVKFAWDDMAEQYDGNSDATDTNAVSTLMMYVAQSLRSSYPAPGWQAYGEFEAYKMALVQYFGYDAGMKVLYRQYYGIKEWEKMIYDELSEGRPVAYFALDNNSRDGFIIDGYKSGRLFHVNWGLGGKYDGYYKLTDLNFVQELPNGIKLDRDLCLQHTAVFGIKPDTGTQRTPDIPLTSMSIYSDMGHLYPKTGASQSVELNIQWTQAMVSDSIMDVETGIGLFDNDGLVKVFYSESHKKCEPGILWGDMWLTIDADVPNGTYYAKTLSRIKGEEVWREDIHSDRNYIVMIISDHYLYVKDVVSPGSEIKISKVYYVGESQDREGWHDYYMEALNEGDEYSGPLYFILPSEYDEYFEPDYAEISSGEKKRIYFQLSSKYDVCAVSLVRWLGVGKLLYNGKITSGIKDSTYSHPDKTGGIYRIDGIKVQNTQKKGIYIKDGKKHAVK